MGMTPFKGLRMQGASKSMHLSPCVITSSTKVDQKSLSIKEKESYSSVYTMATVCIYNHTWRYSSHAPEQLSNWKL